MNRFIFNFFYLVSICADVLFVELDDFYLRNADSKASDMSLIVFRIDHCEFIIFDN